MTSAPTPSASRRVWPFAALGLVLVLLAGGAFLWQRGAAATGPMPAPGIAAPVDAVGLQAEQYRVTMAVLGTIYEAFAQVEEAAIYDGLADVAAGEALEALYLERAGALASGGLPDQVVHELELTGGTWRTEDAVMRADIRWAVLAEVGHAEHTHMRGNAYGAELTIAPANGAWRLTEFRLTDVDRSEAGMLTTIADEGAPADLPG
ncbi:MAG: hypothetical protein AAF321_02315 [Pseudomonadota bacterium]